MKTIIQLILAALLLHACIRAGDAAWRYFSLKDAIEQEVLFASRETAARLEQRVVEIASEHGVELEPKSVAVQRQRFLTTVTYSYRERIPLVPMAYTRDHLFEASVSARSLFQVNDK